MRTPHEVLYDHLKLRNEGNLDADIERNYSEDCMILSAFGVFHGHEGVRQSAGILKQHAPESNFHYHYCMVRDSMGYLEWSAHSDDHAICDGSDSYLIREGKIIVQTIHYRPVE